ncbi:hypothetical protein BJF90_44930 [Pseudonocardia sp. CNS-004]|nr:hypothetical protein BJF90_44930 [Pseudonocardia sp. CNS-004]
MPPAVSGPSPVARQSGPLATVSVRPSAYSITSCTATAGCAPYTRSAARKPNRSQYHPPESHTPTAFSPSTSSCVTSVVSCTSRCS